MHYSPKTAIPLDYIEEIENQIEKLYEMIKTKKKKNNQDNRAISKGRNITTKQFVELINNVIAEFTEDTSKTLAELKRKMTKHE